MNFLIKVSIYILFVQCCEILCKPRYHVKHIEKSFHFELVPLPFEHVALVLKKITPFGKYEFKHDIHKRQIVESEISPVTNEIPVADIVVEDIPKVPEGEIFVKNEKDLAPEVIITSVIKPVENSKSFSFVLPVESEVVIIPAEKGGEVIKHSTEVLIGPEPIPKPEEVVPPGAIIEITPKPVEILPPPAVKPVVFLPPPPPKPVEIPLPPPPKPVVILPPPPPIPVEIPLSPPPKPIEIPHLPPPKPVEILHPPPPPVPKPVVENVIISTPIESTVPPLIPVFENPNVPIISPVIDNLSKTPILFTDITKIPLSGIPYPAPIPVPAPEVIVPPPPPPPPPVKEPPVFKEETPNFFVKGSRFVLYFGSMMLQMLTQLVNGRINLNQPLPAVLPEIQ